MCTCVVCADALAGRRPTSTASEGVGYGWTTSSVAVRRHSLASVITVAGDVITANTMKTWQSPVWMLPTTVRRALPCVCSAWRHCDVRVSLHQGYVVVDKATKQWPGFRHPVGFFGYTHLKNHPQNPHFYFNLILVYTLYATNNAIFYCFKPFKALSYWVFVLFYLFFPACPKKPIKPKTPKKPTGLGFF